MCASAGSHGLGEGRCFVSSMEAVTNAAARVGEVWGEVAEAALLHDADGLRDAVVALRGAEQELFECRVRYALTLRGSAETRRMRDASSGAVRADWDRVLVSAADRTDDTSGCALRAKIATAAGV